MAGITLEQAEAQLATWLTASTAVAAKQSYQIDTGNGMRQLTYADAEQIRANVTYWDRMARQLSRTTTGRRTRQIAPV
jgi:hypothetical protein